MGRMLRAVFATAAGVLAVSSGVCAETLSFAETQRGRLKGGMESCLEEVIRKAGASAVRKVATDLNGKPGPFVEDVARRGDECCVARARVIKAPRDRGTGECMATVKIWVDTLKVAAALKDSKGIAVAKRPPIHVGAVIRLMVDGKLASSETGFNPQEAVTQYQSDLFDLNLRLVNLSVFHDEFDTRRFGSTCAVTDEALRDCTSFVGYARAVQEVLERTRMAVMDRFPDVRLFRKSGGWIAIGEVGVRSAGRDPEGVRYCALGNVTARLFRLETGEIVPAGLVNKRVCAGTTQQEAVRAALVQAVGENAQTIAENLEKRLRR